MTTLVASCAAFLGVILMPTSAQGTFYFPPMTCLAGNPVSITHSQQHDEGETYYEVSAKSTVQCTWDSTSKTYYVQTHTYFSLYLAGNSLKEYALGESADFAATLPASSVRKAVSHTQSGSLHLTAAQCHKGAKYYLKTEAYYRYKSSGSWSQWDTNTVDVAKGVSGSFVLC